MSIGAQSLLPEPHRENEQAGRHGGIDEAVNRRQRGPSLKLYNAVGVAADPKAAGRGVLVVMNDHVLDAHSLTKTSTTALTAGSVKG